MEGLQRSLSACAHWGPLTVLMDVSCGTYDNTACAKALDRINMNDTRVLMRGRDWWWLGPDCTGILDTWNMNVKTTCETYSEPLDAVNESVWASVPVLYECGWCNEAEQRACVRRAVARPAKLTMVQTRSYVTGRSAIAGA